MKPSDILRDPAASTWLKHALSTALRRDPVDAVKDAQVLLWVLDERLAEILPPQKGAKP